jgi:hypothetical protein
LAANNSDGNLRQILRRLNLYFGATAIVSVGTLGILLFHLHAASLPTNPEFVSSQLASLQATLDSQNKRLDERMGRLETAVNEVGLQVRALRVRANVSDRVIGAILGFLLPPPAPPRSPLKAASAEDQLAQAVLDLPLDRPIKEQGVQADTLPDGMRGYRLPGEAGKLIAIHAMAEGSVGAIVDEGRQLKTVEINHGFGYRTVYGHLAEVKVKLNEAIDKDEVIGSVKASAGVCFTAGIVMRGHSVPSDPHELFAKDRR